MKKLYIRKIRNDKVEKLKQWGVTISTERKKEAIDSLVSENVSRELAYITLIGDIYYFVAHMESFGEIIPADMTLPINIDHVAILRECLEPPVIGEELYDLDASQKTS